MRLACLWCTKHVLWYEWLVGFGLSLRQRQAMALSCGQMGGVMPSPVGCMAWTGWDKDGMGWDGRM